MAEPTSFECLIVTPDNVVYEGSALKMFCPGNLQELAILPNHTPLYAQLKEGAVTIMEVGGSKKTFPIDGGILRVRQNRASIIVGF